MSTDTSDAQASAAQKRAAQVITKLLALAEDDGASEPEKEAARAKVKALLNKHELTLDDIDRAEYEIRTIKMEYKQAPGWYKVLGVHVSTFLGVFVLYCKPTGWSEDKAKWRVSGRPQDIDIFEYMMENIKRQIYALADEWKTDRDQQGLLTRRADTNSFRVGAVKRVGVRLENMLEEMNETESEANTDTETNTPNTTALTLTEQSTAKRNKAKDVMRRDYGGWTSGSGASHSGSGYSAGYSAGKRVTVRRATKKTTSTRKLS